MISRLIKRYGISKLKYLLVDLVAFNAGVFIALGLHENYVIEPFFQLVSLDKIAIFYGVMVISIVSFRYHNLYKQRVYNSFITQGKLLAKNLFLTIAFLLILLFLFKPDDVLAKLRTQVLGFIVVSYGLIVLNRLGVQPWIERIFRLKRTVERNIVAIGAGEVGQRFAMELKERAALGLRLIGFLDDNEELHGSMVDGVSVIGTTRDLANIVEEQDIDEIFITINHIDHTALLNLVRKCSELDCQVNIVSEQFGIIRKKIGTEEFKDFRYVPVFQRISPVYVNHLKRWFDLVIALALMVLLFPFFLILATAIKLTSRGPIFYVPQVVGRHGKLFPFYKFRSMYHKVSNESHRKLVEEFMSGKIVGAKLRDDPRVTSVGHIIRKFSLDEFAQLINVVRGDMSLVGPRPSTIYEYEMMEDWHKRRFDAIPGMTGLWQVSGRSEVSYTDMIIMDLYYIENCSFWFDLLLLLKTIGVVIKAKGGH